MGKQKKSAPALFMYAVIFITAICAVISFSLYYGGVRQNGVVLWMGIVSFMIMYHLWSRIIMGNVSKLIKINQSSWWFREKSFEKGLYKFLRVKKWKDKVPTYNPQAFSLENHTLDEIATAMAKSELDHWINEVISLTSILFAILWGEVWIFAITAFLAMLFDAQFIAIQRYNRPKVLRILKKQAMNKKSLKIKESFTLSS